MARTHLYLVALALVSSLSACADDDNGGGNDPYGLDDIAAPVFVDADAAPGGDGSLERPYIALAEALIDVAQGGEVVVAAGRYALPSALELSGSVTLRGAGAGLTVLSSAVDVQIDAGTLRLNNLDLDADLQLFGDAVRMVSVDVLSDAKLSLAPTATVEIEGGRFTDADTLTIDGSAQVTLRDLVWEGGRGARIRDVSELTADGLTFSDVGGVALWLERTEGTVRSTAVRDVWARSDESPVDGVGVQIDGGRVTLAGVNVVRTEQRGIAVAGGDVTLERVSIAGGGLTGLSVQIDAVVQATDLTIVEAATLVFASGSSLTLDAPRLELAGGTGILASNGAELVVRDAFMSECPDGHVSVLGEGTSLMLLDSVLQDAPLASCVQLSDSRAPQRLENNTIVRCGGAGVGILEADDVEIRGNEIAGVLPDPVLPDLADGIQMVDARVRIVGNHLHDNDGAGISGARSTGRFEGNRIIGHGDAGIRLVDPYAGQGADEPTLVIGNVIERAQGVGIFAFTTFAEVRDNRIDGVAYLPADGLGEGVLFGTRGDVVVEDNDIQNAGGNGVMFVDGAFGTVANNFIANVGQAGIRELCAEGLADNDVEVRDNVIEGASTAEIALCP